MSVHTLNFDLSAIPGLRHAALVNPAGQITASYGQMEGDSTIAAVLAQAALSAAIDLGQRSAMGDCQEMTLTYPNSSLLVSATADGYLLLFQHAAETPLNLLRQQAREIFASLETTPPAPPPNTSRLMDALNAAQP